MNKLEKLKAELEKARAKRSLWDEKVKVLERKCKEEENSQIFEIVHAAKLTPEELADLIQKARATGKGTKEGKEDA